MWLAGQKALSAEILLESLRCLLALADAPDFGLRIAVGFDTLLAVLSSSVDSGLTPAFILCATVLEKSFAQHEPASITGVNRDRLLQLLFWGVERHHGYVSAEGDRATFRACFLASACALRELLKWHTRILPFTPQSAHCIHQSLVVACQALTVSSSDAQAPDLELLTVALKLLAAVQDVVLSSKYQVAQRSTGGVASELYGCLPAMIEHSAAPCSPRSEDLCLSTSPSPAPAPESSPSSCGATTSSRGSQGSSRRRGSSHGFSRGWRRQTQEIERMGLPSS